MPTRKPARPVPAAKKPVPGAAAAKKAPVKDRGAEDGRADFAALAAEYKKVPRAQVIAPRTDAQEAIAFALGIAARVSAPKLRARFASLPAAELNVALLDRLPQAARAARSAFLNLATVSATTENAKVSLRLIQQGTELRGRMLAVCEYLLGDQPEYAAELRAIRLGSGYLDLAGDLSRLAEIYAAEADVVRKDPKHYRSTDAKDAGRTAAAILAELGSSDATTDADAKGGKLPAAREAAYRAFALLVTVYDEIAAAGRFLLRNEGGNEIFSSLTTAGRAKPRRTKKPAAGPTPAPPK